MIEMARTKPKINKNLDSISPSVPSTRKNKPVKKTNSNSNHLDQKNGMNGDGKNGNGLTRKQALFVQEYLIDLNATQAAIRAGYSEYSAPIIGYENLTKPKIMAAIDEAMKERAERTRVTQDKIIKELAKIAFSNMRSFVKWGPGRVELLDSRYLSEEDAACVSEISMTETSAGATVRFKLHDKKAAIELLGKHLGMFSDTVRNVHVGEGGGPVEHKFDFDDKTIKAAFDRLYGYNGAEEEKKGKKRNE